MGLVQRMPRCTRLLLSIVHPDLNEETPTLIGAVVETYSLVIRFPALSQEGAVLKRPVELHDGGEA
jgi:hypothetical protein